MDLLTKYRLEDNITKHYPQQIAILKERISGMTEDIQTAKANLLADKPVQRASLKEKLEAFKAGAEKQENHKEKGKEVTM